MKIVVALSALLLASACSLTSNAPPLDVRYFSIDAAQRPPRLRAAMPTAALSLGRVHSSAFLRDQIVFRTDDGALGTYEQARWTEYPEAYLRRSLSDALFDDAGLVQRLGPDVPTLDVELLAFEEVRRGDLRAGRVKASYRLRQGDRVLLSDVVAFERPAPAAGGMPAIVNAIENALSAVTASIASAVRAHLVTRSQP